MLLCVSGCRMQAESGWNEPIAPASTHRKPVEGLDRGPRAPKVQEERNQERLLERGQQENK